MEHTVRPIAACEIDACAAVYCDAYRKAPWNEALSPEQVGGYIRAFTGREGFCAWRLAVEGEIAGVALGIVVPCVDAPFLRIEDFCIAPDSWVTRRMKRPENRRKISPNRTPIPV